MNLKNYLNQHCFVVHQVNCKKNINICQLKYMQINCLFDKGLKFLIKHHHVFRDSLLNLKNGSSCKIKIGRQLLKSFSQKRQKLCIEEWNLKLGEQFAPNDIFEKLIMNNKRCLINSIKINYSNYLSYVFLYFFLHNVSKNI